MAKTSKTILADFHSHTNYQDGVNTPREMVTAAIEKGLQIYGISEHHPRPPVLRYLDDPPGQIRGGRRFPEFLKEMTQLKQEFAGRIELLKASEFDWWGHNEFGQNGPEAWQTWRQETNWDYVIGSVHFLDSWGFDYLPDWKQCLFNLKDLTEIYTKYFTAVTTMIQQGQKYFEIVGHLDLIKKFVQPPPDLLQFALPALDALAQTNLILELSSAGLVKDCREQYPSLAILKAAREREIPIILNSDAHISDRIAYAFPELTALAKEAGYTTREILHAGGKRETVQLCAAVG